MLFLGIGFALGSLLLIMREVRRAPEAVEGRDGLTLVEREEPRTTPGKIGPAAAGRTSAVI